MANRRLLLFAVALLLLGSIAGALTPRREPAGKADAPRFRAAVPRVQATLPSPAAVQARVGDLVSLRVRSSTPDEAGVADFGLTAPVGPDLVAELTFVADRPGRFPVRLDIAEREVGVLLVRPR